MSRPFAARYYGRCEECDEHIVPEQIVRYNEYDQIVHDDCPTHAPLPDRPAVVCTTCWLTICDCEED